MNQQLKLVCMGAVLAGCTTANAHIVNLTYADLPGCDALVAGPAQAIEYWLLPPQPPPAVPMAPQKLGASDVAVPTVVCPATDMPAMPNYEVSITNWSLDDQLCVYYVTDPQTSMSNIDGLINGQEAFRIDTVGVHAPLISESIAADGIWQSGETWKFIIQDYANSAMLAASAFMSPGQVGNLSMLDGVSSGSIVVVPEPGHFALLAGMGLMGFVAYRRIRQ